MRFSLGSSCSSSVSSSSPLSSSSSLEPGSFLVSDPCFSSDSGSLLFPKVKANGVLVAFTGCLGAMASSLLGAFCTGVLLIPPEGFKVSVLLYCVSGLSCSDDYVVTLSTVQDVFAEQQGFSSGELASKPEYPKRS